MDLNFLNDLPEYNKYPTRMIFQNTDSTAFILGDDYLLTVFKNNSPLKMLLDNIDYFASKGLVPVIVASGSTAGLDDESYLISKLTKGTSLSQASDVNQVELIEALAKHLILIKNINTDELIIDKSKPLGFAKVTQTIRTIISSQPCGNDQKVYTDILEQGLNEPECPPGIVWGNIIPENIIILDGKFAGFLTLPILAYGDSCFDLSIGYEYFDKEFRDKFFNLISPDQSIRKKARNWALSKALTSMNDDEKSAMKTLYNIFEEYYS